jgi:hypothetical protein
MPVRAVSYWAFKCRANPLYFIKYENVPDVLKDELEVNGALPCDGSGEPGPWCEDCRFGMSEGYDSIDEII